MNLLKRFSVLILTAFLLCGCNSEPVPYEYVNRDEPIESIELIYYPFFHDPDEEFGVFVHIRMLEENEFDPFMDALYEIPTYEFGFGDPPSNFGAYIAKVNYGNGETEYFGSNHIEHVEKGSEAWGIGYFCFDKSAFEKLFFEYAGDLSYLISE